MTIRRIELQQIVLFGINLCLRLGTAKPSQYNLDALKKKMVPQGNCMRLLMCDGCRKALQTMFVWGTYQWGQMWDNKFYGDKCGIINSMRTGLNDYIRFANCVSFCLNPLLQGLRGIGHN